MKHSMRGRKEAYAEKQQKKPKQHKHHPALAAPSLMERRQRRECLHPLAQAGQCVYHPPFLHNSNSKNKITSTTGRRHYYYCQQKLQRKSKTTRTVRPVRDGLAVTLATLSAVRHHKHQRIVSSNSNISINIRPARTRLRAPP